MAVDVQGAREALVTPFRGGRQSLNAGPYFFDDRVLIQVASTTMIAKTMAMRTAAVGQFMTSPFSSANSSLLWAAWHTSRRLRTGCGTLTMCPQCRGGTS